MIQIRIAPDQKRLLEEAARKMGLSLSAWIRLVALKAERATHRRQMIANHEQPPAGAARLARGGTMKRRNRGRKMEPNPDDNESEIITLHGVADYLHCLTGACLSANPKR